MFAKIGPGANTIWRAAGGRVFLDDVRAGDVRRHQVGRELDAVELEVEHLRERPDEQRLRQAGHADDQAVAADEQRQQHLIDDVVLPDDELAELGDDLLLAAFILSASAMSSGESITTVSLDGFHDPHKRKACIDLRYRSSIY